MADTQPEPTTVGPMPYERLNPSPDVQAKVAAAVQACTDWHPENGMDIFNALAKRGTVEAQVCGVLDQWPRAYEFRAESNYITGLSFGLSLAVALPLVWRVFRVFFDDIPHFAAAAMFAGYAIAGAIFGVGLGTLSLAFFLHAPDGVDKVLSTWISAVQVASPICAAAFVLWAAARAGYLHKAALRNASR